MFPVKLTKMIALCLIISLSAIPAAQAWPHGPGGPGRPGGGPGPRPGMRGGPDRFGPRPEPRHGGRPGHWGPGPRHGYCPDRWGPGPRHYRHSYHNDDWWWIPGGIILGGLILDGMNNSSTNDAARLEELKARDKKTQEIKSYCADTVQKELGHAADNIAQVGLPAYLEQMRRYWETKGMPPFLDDRPNIAILTVSGLKDNVKLEYTVLKDFKELTVRATNAEYQISEERKTYYKDPLPVASTRKYLGVDLAPVRDGKGNAVAGEVAPGTAAAYAGISPGDAIVRIDAYQTSALGADRINAYVEHRAQAHSLLKITFMHLGKPKTVEIQL